MATIITKFSSTASAIPTSSDLVQGELALNTADKRLFSENASAVVFEIGTNPSSVTTGTLDVSGAANFTAALTANSSLNSSNVVFTGGTVNGVVIGGTTASAITGTLITASTNFAGALTGNVTGNLTGSVTGNVTGDLSGNVTASSGTTTLNNLVINGTVDFNAAELTDLAEPTASTSAATRNYVDTQVSNLVGGAPAALDTLNELAAALNDDAAFNTTITNSIATKLPLAGGTMTGAIAMGSSKITGLADGAASGDAINKGQLDTMLPLAGGTMTGNIVLGSNKATSTATPSASDDLTRKGYVDGILGSATSAATSAATATTKASEAATSASNAATSATSAASSATSAAASYDSFDDRYLGAKSSSPSVDNDGDALLTGALYWDTTAEEMRVYTGTGWTAAGSAINGTSNRQVYTATSGQTTFTITYDVGYVDVYLNGSKLKVGTDFTATSGTNIVLAAGATTGDIVDIVAYGAFNVANTYTQAAADARFAQVSNNLSDLASASTARTNLGLAIGTDVQAYDAQLADVAGLTPTDGNIIIGDGTNFVTESGSTARTSLGVSIGSDVQAYDSNLTSFVGTFTLPTSDGTADQVLKTNGSGVLSFGAGGSLTPMELTLISGSDVSSTSSIQFTGLSNSYDYYLLFIHDLDTNGSQQNPSLTYSSNNGSSYSYNAAASGNARSYGLRSNGGWQGETDSSTTRIYTYSTQVTAYTYIYGIGNSEQVYFTTEYHSRHHDSYYGYQLGRSNNGSTNINAIKLAFGSTATSGKVSLYGVTI